MRNYTTTRSVNKGAPQGGVLSSLLWNMVVNDLLISLETEGYKVNFVSGKQPQVLSELLHKALNRLKNWAKCYELDVSSHKTELYFIPNQSVVSHFYTEGS